MRKTDWMAWFQTLNYLYEYFWKSLSGDGKIMGFYLLHQTWPPLLYHALLVAPLGLVFADRVRLFLSQKGLATLVRQPDRRSPLQEGCLKSKLPTRESSPLAALLIPITTTKPAETIIYSF